METKIKPDPKILQRSIEAATLLAHKIRSQYQAGKINTWGELADYGLEIPNLTDDGRKNPIDKAKGHFFLFAEPLLTKYIAGTEARLIAALNAPPARRKLVLSPPDSCRKLGKYTLFREQEPVVSSVIDYLYTQPSPGRLALVPAGTGSGKTQIAIGVIKHVLENNIHLSLGIPFPYPVIWLTVKNAVIQTRQRIIDCGLGAYLDKDIHVLSYSALTSGFGRERFINFFTVTDPHTGIESQALEYKPIALASLLILDEVHCLAREDSLRTKAIRAYDEAARAFPALKTKILAMSATPAEKVNDGRVITCLADITYQNTKISWDNFNLSFAKLITPDPHIPSKASVERLFAAWQEIVFEPPYIKWPFKAINACRLYNFRNQQDEDFANSAVERYIDRTKNLGRDVPSDLAMARIELGQLRKSLEPCRSELMVDDMVREVNAGNSALCGTAFTGTIIRSVFYLQDTYNIPRSQISIIWGGRKDPRPSRILTLAELVELACQPELSPRDLRLLQQQMDWKEDKLLFGDENEAAQDGRYSRLKALGLIGPQSQEIRQREIDKYQLGEALFCFFTMASGGTGLSLEHCDSRQRPRVGFYTPIYNAKEWVQALGRPHRRNSISDTRQYICLLKGTLEETHVAPKLDAKLQALGAGFSTTTKDDVFSALLTLKAEQLRTKVQAAIRTEQQAILDSDNEATQLHEIDIHDDEDED